MLEIGFFCRLSIANFMESTEGKCCICDHEYLDVDDVISRDPILVKWAEKNKIACRICYNIERNIGIK